MKPLIIGMAGASASGKTTLARALAAALGDELTLITHDRYYHSVPDPLNFNYDEPAAFDTALLERQLGELAEGRSVGLPSYDFKHHRRLGVVEVVEPREVVLLEGILVLAEPALRARMDLTVFVDTPLDICLIRRIRRDAIERGRGVESVLSQYMRDVRPAYFQYILPAKHDVHLLLDGTRPAEESLGALLSTIRARRAVSLIPEE